MEAGLRLVGGAQFFAMLWLIDWLIHEAARDRVKVEEEATGEERRGEGGPARMDEDLQKGEEDSALGEGGVVGADGEAGEDAGTTLNGEEQGSALTGEGERCLRLQAEGSLSSWGDGESWRPLQVTFRLLI